MPARRRAGSESSKSTPFGPTAEQSDQQTIDRSIDRFHCKAGMDLGIKSRQTRCRGWVTWSHLGHAVLFPTGIDRSVRCQLRHVVVCHPIPRAMVAATFLSDSGPSQPPPPKP